MESEAAGIGYEIDHYLPKEHFKQKRDDYLNLMWSCRPCNRNKADYYPATDQDAEAGMRIINPDVENPLADHFRVDGARLEPTTAVGKFNEIQLRLNRDALLKLRSLRERFAQASKLIAGGLRGLLDLHIDQFPNPYRTRIERLKQTASTQSMALRREVTRIIREVARSPLLDPDSNAAEHQMRRRAYLRSVGAMGARLADNPRSENKGRKNK